MTLVDQSSAHRAAVKPSIFRLAALALGSDAFWAGHGRLPSKWAIEAARDLVHALCDKDCPQPDIFEAGDGSIALVWPYENETLYVLVSDTGMLEFSVGDGAGTLLFSGPTVMDPSDVVINVFSHLLDC